MTIETSTLTDVAAKLGLDIDDVTAADEFERGDGDGPWSAVGAAPKLVVRGSYAELDATHSDAELDDVARHAEAFGWVVVRDEGQTVQGRTRYPLVPTGLE